MKDKIVKILTDYIPELNSDNQLLNSNLVKEIELLFEKEVLKGKIEVLYDTYEKNKPNIDLCFIVAKEINILNERLKKLNNESN